MKAPFGGYVAPHTQADLDGFQRLFDEAVALQRDHYDLEEIECVADELAHKLVVGRRTLHDVCDEAHKACADTVGGPCSQRRRDARVRRLMKQIDREAAFRNREL